jgi:hypothetical protein
MYQDLFEFKSFGKIDQIKFVLDTLSQTNAPLPLTNLRKYCTDYSSLFSTSFNGIIRLLELTEYIQCKNNLVRINELYGFSPILIENFSMEIPAKLLSVLAEAGIIKEFINLDGVDYDLVSSNIVIKNSSIPLRASALKQFFIDFGIFQISPSSTFIYFITPAFSNFFENSILPTLQDEEGFVPESGFTYKEFMEIQELKRQYGEQAEIFVERYEQERLKKHPKRTLIKRISPFKVDAGYDIVSYEKEDSAIFDRFIEVKSFSGSPEFYWSKNEIKVAKQKKKNYYLYLVDRTYIQDSGYRPLIIKNPYNIVFIKDEWKKEPQNWLIKKSPLAP